MSGVSLSSVVLAQLDKVILSRLLPLDVFGYYTFASAVSGNLTRLSGPVYMSVYPRLTQLVALGHKANLAALYHQSCQVVSVLIVPAAAVICLFSEPILLLWTKSPETAAQTHVLLSILTVGTCINGLLYLPYALQYAHGWVRLSLFYNLASIVVLAPLIAIMSIKFGAVGAACMWVAYNLGFLIIGILLMHRRVLPGEAVRWYFEDIGLPIVAAALTVALARWLIPLPTSQFGLLILLTGIFFAAAGMSMLAAPLVRQWVRQRLARFPRAAYPANGLP